MELWDSVVSPREGELEGFDRKELADLALDVIEAVIPLFKPDFRTFFPPEHGDLIVSLVDFRREHSDNWYHQSPFFSDLLAQYDALPEVPIRPAVGPFMMAVVRLAEGIDEGRLNVGEAMEVLSSCYEAILVSQVTTRRVTVADERDSSRCRDAMARQMNLIDSYLMRHAQPG